MAGRLESGAGFEASSSRAAYPARSTAALSSSTATVDTAWTVARSVARLTAALITPGSFSNAASTLVAHEAQVMPSICREDSVVPTS